LYLSIRRALKQIVVIVETFQSCELRTKVYPVFCCQVLLLRQKKLLEINNVEIEVKGYLLNIYSAVVILKKKANKTRQCITCL